MLQMAEKWLCHPFDKSTTKIPTIPLAEDKKRGGGAWEAGMQLSIYLAYTKQCGQLSMVAYACNCQHQGGRSKRIKKPKVMLTPVLSTIWCNSSSLFCIQSSIWLFSSFSSSNAGDQVQEFVHAGQVPHHRAYGPRLPVHHNTHLLYFRHAFRGARSTAFFFSMTYFYFVWIGIFPACVRMLDLLELELLTILSCPEGAGNWTWSSGRIARALNQWANSIVLALHFLT